MSMQVSQKPKTKLELMQQAVTKEFAHYAPTLKDVLPKHISERQVARYVLTELIRDESLQKCTPVSLVFAAIQAAIFGVEPSNQLGYGYIVPYGSQATFIPGYLGFIKLGRQSPDVEDWQLHCVYANDEFSVEYGTKNDLTHKPVTNGDRGELIGAYSVIWLKNGRVNFLYMPREEIEKRKKISKTANFNGKSINMWRDFEDQAFMKTVARNHAKTLPRSTELDKLIEYENLAEESGAPPRLRIDTNTKEIVYDVTPEVPDKGNGIADKLAAKMKSDPVEDKSDASTFIADWETQDDDAINELYQKIRSEKGDAASLKAYWQKMAIKGTVFSVFREFLQANRKAALAYLFWASEVGK